MQKTDIEWTDFSANPLKLELPDGRRVNACVKISEGCAHCYAESMVRRFWRKAWGKFPGYSAALLKLGKPVLVEDELQDVLRLDAKIAAGKADSAINRIFWNDMSDEYLDFWPEALLDHIWAVRALTPSLIHQVLTKRPQRLAEYLNDPTLPGRIYRVINDWLDDGEAGILGKGLEAAHNVTGWRTDGDPTEPEWNLPLPNCWLGTSVENQKRADERIPHLLQCPAAVRFLSMEPLLGPIDLFNLNARTPDQFNCLYGWKAYAGPDGSNRVARVDWVIVGGESGHGSRPCYTNWIDSTVAQCKAARVAMFVKQLGSNHRCIDDEFGDVEIKLKDSKGGEIEEFPADLRVREMPDVVAAEEEGR